MFPEERCGHAQKVEGVVGVAEESGQRRARQGIGTRGWGESHARGEGSVGQVVVQVDSDAMDVLCMLQQEPGAGEGLLTGGADVAGRLTFISSLLFGADPSGRCEPPLFVLLSARCHLNAHLHRHGTPAQLQRPRPGGEGDPVGPARPLPRFGEGARRTPQPPA